MTTKLAGPCRSEPLKFTREENRIFAGVVAQKIIAERNCCRELYLSFFFDGTNNNLERDKPKGSHSNVARLYDVFPLALNDGRIPIYVPGVGTPFKEIGDTGEGNDLLYGQTDRRRGLAFAGKGEARIVWALLQAINSVHRYFLYDVQIDRDNAKTLANTLTQPKPLTPIELGMTALGPLPPVGLVAAQSALLSRFIDRRTKINAHRRAKLKELCKKLDTKVAPLRLDYPRVKKIRVSIFGFSRGAAQARAFSNWFIEMCRDASEGAMALAGIPVEIDFVGLFDTVASVGLANSVLVADGHMEWADAERGLRIAPEVKQCLHLVSAHELRRSFPLDSVSVGQSLPGNCVEIVYPGVHSDLGGGYKPTEQGRGLDAQGHDMASRIPLAEMYRAARLAGVPLDVQGPGVATRYADALKVAPATIAAFNAYLACCHNKTGPLSRILKEQSKLYTRWRKLRLTTMASVASVQRAAAQDRTDLLAANEELKTEVAMLEAELRQPPLATLVSLPTVVVYMVREHIKKRGLDPYHYQDWLKLRSAWHDHEPLPAAVVDWFDNYVHDSRAWFKPFGKDDDIWEAEQQKRMAKLQAKERAYREFEALPAQQKALFRDPLGMPFESPFMPLTQTEQAELDAYRRQAQLPTQSKGREPRHMGAGYMRFRRVYYGSDAAFVVPETMIVEHSFANA